MNNRLYIIIGVLLLLLLGTFLISLAIGAVSIPLIDIIRLIIPQKALSSDLSKIANIVLRIRLPRSLGAMLAGASLALSGAAIQGLFRNPMASPQILGISAGGSFAAILTISTGLQILHPLVLPLATFLGAILTTLLVYVIGSLRGEVFTLYIVLAGLAISSFLTGLVSALLLFSQRYEIQQFLFWTLGGLDGLSTIRLVWTVPLSIIAGIILMWKFPQVLNLLALGDEQAHSLGISLRSTKLSIIVLCSLLTAMSISLVGPIGFVGLIVPHGIRLVLGADNRRLLPISFLAGSVFLLLCDIIGRTIIAPLEIKTGIITSIIGSPYFIFLIIRHQKRGRLHQAGEGLL